LTVESLKSQWDDLLRALRERNLSLEALMRSCEPVGVDGDVIVLGFAYGLHRGKVETNENKQMVEDALSDLAGRRCRAQCVLLNDVNGTEPATRSAAQSEAPGGADLSIQELMERDPLVRTAVEDLGARVVTSRQQ